LFTLADCFFCYDSAFLKGCVTSVNKLKNDESFKHQLADFEQFLSMESKTIENRQKDKDLFIGILWTEG
jgi:hypothetical protein